jgi:hypothetical protein
MTSINSSFGGGGVYPQSQMQSQYMQPPSDTSASSMDPYSMQTIPGMDMSGISGQTGDSSLDTGGQSCMGGGMMSSNNQQQLMPLIVQTLGAVAMSLQAILAQMQQMGGGQAQSQPDSSSGACMGAEISPPLQQLQPFPSRCESQSPFSAQSPPIGNSDIPPAYTSMDMLPMPPQ